MITITRDVFVGIFQIDYILAVKLDMCDDKDMRFLVIPICPKAGKYSFLYMTGPLKLFTFISFLPLIMHFV